MKRDKGMKNATVAPAVLEKPPVTDLNGMPDDMPFGEGTAAKVEEIKADTPATVNYNSMEVIDAFRQSVMTSPGPYELLTEEISRTRSATGVRSNGQ
jgi:hypothetical protein